MDDLVNKALGINQTNEIKLPTLSEGLASFGQLPVANIQPTPQEIQQQNIIKATEVLNNPGSANNVAASFQNDTSLKEEQFSKDLQNLSYGELVQTYGENVAKNRYKFIRDRKALQEKVQFDDRSTGDVATDLTIDALTGATQGAGSLLETSVSVGLQALSGPLGRTETGRKVISDISTGINKGTSSFSEALQSLKSEESKERVELTETLRSDLRNQLQSDFEENKRNSDSNITANLKKLGSGFTQEIGLLANDPSTSASIVAQGLGSLATSAGVVGKIGKITNGSKAGIAGGVGIVEASGTNSQTVSAVLELSEEELSKGSSEYNTLRQTMSHEEARKIVALDAGTLAFAKQLPTATVIGLVAGKFEAAPLSAGSVKEAGINIASQAVEETLQSGTGELNSNAAIQQIADSSQDVLENVGSSAAQGGLGGLGAAGLTQTPAVVGNTVNNAFNTASEVAKTVGKTVTDVVEARKAQIDQSIDESSPVGSEAIKSAKESVINNLIKAHEVDPESISEPLSVLDIQTDQLNSIPQAVKDVVTLDENDTNNVLDILDDLKVNIDNIPADKRNDAVLYASKLVESINSYIVAEGEVSNEILSVKDNLLTYTSDPKIKALVEEARNIETPVVEDVSEITQEQITNLEHVAEVNPTGVDPKLVDAVLDQHARGKIVIPEILVKKISAASAIAKQLEKSLQLKTGIEQERVDNINNQPNDGTRSKVKPRKTSSIVSREINIDGKKIKTKNGEKTLLSLNDLYTDVIRSISNKGTTIDRNGVVTDAQSSFDHLRNFATHLTNKVNAINKSAEGGKGEQIKFDTLTQAGFIKAGEKGSNFAFANAKSPAANALAKNVLVDAYSAIDLYNNLLTLYPELNGEKIDKPILHQSLDNGFKVPSDDDLFTKAFTPSLGDPNQEQPTDIIEAPEVADEPQALEDTQVASEESGSETDPNRQQPEEVIDEQKDDKKKESTQGETIQEDQETKENTIDSDVEENISEEKLDYTNPNLIKSDGVSRFYRAFKDNGKSLFSTIENPYKFFKEALSSYDNLQNSVSTELTYTVSDDKLKSFVGITDKVIPELVKRLNDNLDKASYNKNETVKQALANGKKLYDQKNYKVVNLIDETTGRYDQRLIEQASLAAFDWIIKSSQGRIINREETAKAFGVTEDNVTIEMENAINFGDGSVASREALAQNILKFWGMDTNNDVTIWDTRGIPESLASELLVAMDGFITESKKFKVSKFKDDELIEVDYVAISSSTDLTHEIISKEFKKNIGSAKNLLGDLFIKGNTPEFYFGSAPKEVVKTQKRNPLSKITDKETNVIKEAQKIKFYRNNAFITLMNAMGEDAFNQILGSQQSDNNNTNVIDLKSIEGKNLSNKMGYDGVLNQDQQLKEYADKNDIHSDDVPIHYNWYITKVGRLHMEGFGPQSDKTAREAFLPTVSTLNLNNKKDSDAFWMTIAQSSGLVKTEKVTRSDAVKQAKDIYDLYPQTIDIFSTMLEGENGTLTDEEINTVLNEVGQANTKLLHSLLAVAQHDNAYNAGTQDKFKHMLSLEADGVTDGPINAMMHFLSGRFTKNQFDLLGKGGFYPNEKNKSLNDHIINEGDNYADLYLTGASRFNELLIALKEELEETAPESARYMKALLNFSNHFGEITYEEGNLIIGRNTLKNPLTVTVYGSGINGIANKVSSALMTAFYEEVTKKLRNKENKFDAYPGVDEDMKILFGGNTFKNPKTLKWVNNDNNTDLPSSKNLNNYEFTLQNKKNFTNNVKNLFVNPMYQAINEMMGDTTKTIKQFQDVSQIQSIILIDKFQQRLDEVLKEKRESGDIGSNEFLSQNDYNQIFKDVEKFGAIVENDEQVLNFATAEKGESRYEFARSLDGKISGQSTLPAPSEAGVRAAPYITISRGDANMVLNIYNGDGSLLRSIPVFDGIELAASDIDLSSEKINKAVAKAWAENPAKDVANSFNSFLRNKPLEGISSNADKRIREILGAEPEANLEEYLQGLRKTLNDTAISIQARKDALNEITYSVDHMSSAESPYTNEGILLEGDIVAALNEIYESKLAKDQKEAIAKEDKDFVEQAKLRGFVQNDVVSLDKDGFASLIEAVKLTPELKQIADAVIPNLDDDLSIVLGSPEKLTAYRDQLFPERNDGELIKAGQIDILNKVIYITNQSPETALHEAVHATTMGKVMDFYANPELLNDQDKDAIKRLEALMSDFLKQDYRYDDAATRNAVSDAIQAINEHLANNTDIGKASALNEFMSWTLTNQNLIGINKETRVRNPLAKIGRKVIALMKRLLGSVKGDVFSNILFNTKVLLDTPRNVLDSLSPNIQLQQLSEVGSNKRLADLAQLFDAKIHNHLKNREISEKYRNHRNEFKAGISTNLFTSNGFPMNMQQKQVFNSIQVALATQMEMDNLSLVRAQKIYKQVVDKLNVESFEPYSTDRLDAQNKFNTITGAFGNQIDDFSNTNLLSSFIALAQVDEDFRKILADIKLPETINIDTNSTDSFLNSLGNSMLNSLALTVTREGVKNKNTQEALDNLAVSLGKIEKDSASYIELNAQKLLSKGDKKGSSLLKQLGDKFADFADNRQANADTRLKRHINQSAVVLSGLLNEDRGAAMVKVGTSYMNTSDIFTPIREVYEEIIGRTDDNSIVLDLVNKVKYAVSSVRQDFRETLPEIIAEKFTRKLTKKEWSELYDTFGRTDASSLGSTYNINTFIGLVVEGNKRQNEIKKLEDELKTLDSGNFSKYQNKSKQLAKFMMTGIAGHNLLRNASAIANLLNEDANKLNVTDRTIELIDHLTTMYALDLLPQEVKERMHDLSKTEKDGIEFMSFYLNGLRNEENKKVQNEVSELNSYKGYIPNEVQDGVSLIVAEDSMNDELVRMGYVRKGDYKGSGIHIETGKRGYYYSAVSGKNTYSQGAMQTVQTAVNGVDPRSGKTVSGSTAGIITGSSVRVINKRLKSASNLNDEEALLPVFSRSGEVVAFERAMNPNEMKSLDRNSHLGEMMGAWRGRQAEEQIAQGFNEMLVDNIKKIWDRDKREKADEFINLSDSNLDDPVFKDTWSVVPFAMREYISSVFGEDGFMVRKDMINNALGYRNASIADAWTGNTRLKPGFQKALVNSATFMFGKDTFKYLVTGESGLQTAVSTAKNIIVIRSVFIPVANIMSNQLQLLMRGVQPRDLLKVQRTKLVEIDAHLKNLRRRNEIEAELLTVRNSPIKVRKLEVEKRSLDDSDRRMSIHPLIEAGEFGTISEGLTDIDASLTSGRFIEYLEGIVDKFPEGVRTAGKYAILSRDTALYQGMSRAVQYGDFLGKAVLYDHLTKREGLSHKDAMSQVTNEFVNFNLLPGRTRSYTESMGLTWFWNFKLRTMKVALNMAQNNPVRLLLTGLAGPVMPDLGIGSPVTDNFLSVAADDRLKYSIGPEMMFRSPELNPWVNLLK